MAKKVNEQINAQEKEIVKNDLPEQETAQEIPEKKSFMERLKESKAVKAFAAAAGLAGLALGGFAIGKAVGTRDGALGVLETLNNNDSSGDEPKEEPEQDSVETTEF